MYRIIYNEDTPQNRKSFLESWFTTLCTKQDEINYGISAKTISLNFTREYFPISEHDLILAFIDKGYKAKVKDDNVFFNVSSSSPFIECFRKGWN